MNGDVKDSSAPFEATIAWIKKETGDTFTYALSIRDAETGASYSFKPGQFNMLYIPGIGEAPISISSAPTDPDFTHTIRTAGDVTTHIARLSEGDSIGIRGPFGRGWPLEEAEDRELIILAGGLGIAPLRPVIRQIINTARLTCPQGKKPLLLYGAKTPRDVVFRDEFPRYRDAFEVRLTVDKADPEELWKGDVGLITELLGKVAFNPVNTVAFVCGPEMMMQSVVGDLLRKGVPGEKIFVALERNMNCGRGVCGHCFFGPKFVCKDGPVFRYTEIEAFFGKREV